MSEKNALDYANLLKAKEVVKEFPVRSMFGVVKATAKELLEQSEFGKIYKIGPVKKDKPLNGLREHIINIGKRDKISVECRTVVLEDGGYLFFRKKK